MAAILVSAEENDDVVLIEASYVRRRVSQFSLYAIGVVVQWSEPKWRSERWFR